jgi:hypothetical protein
VVEQPATPEEGNAHIEGSETGPDSAEPGNENGDTYDPLAAAREDHDVIVAGLDTIAELCRTYVPI